MKKTTLAGLIALTFVALLAVAPSADAGTHRRVVRRIYSYHYVAPYRYSAHHGYYYRPYYSGYSYYRPTYRPSYTTPPAYCYRPYRYSSRPHFSIGLGF